MGDGHEGRTDPLSAPVVRFALSATPRSVAEARHRIVAFAQEHTTDRDVHERVAIAFSEAFTNAVRHAYPGDRQRADDDIFVSADVGETCLEIVVSDHGQGFHAHSSSPGLGAGMNLIAQCADAFGIRERLPSGTEIRMRFDLPAGSDASVRVPVEEGA